MEMLGWYNKDEEHLNVIAASLAETEKDSRFCTILLLLEKLLCEADIT